MTISRAKKLPLSAQAKKKLFSALRENNPAPATELQYKNNYQLLVAVVLSAQATDTGVNKATKNLFAKVKTPQQMLNLGEQGLTAHIRTIGLFRAKAKNIIALSEILTRNHAGKIPRTREELESLPGVGRKTANVILNTVYGDPVIAVDTHVFRVSNRTGLAKGKTPLEVEKQLTQQIPAEYLQHAHHWLILHGRHTCRAKNPNCPECIINPQCQWQHKSSLPSGKGQW